MDLIDVANHEPSKLIPASQRELYAFADVGVMAQNAYLYCASVNLATVYVPGLTDPLCPKRWNLTMTIGMTIAYFLFLKINTLTFGLAHPVAFR